MAWTPGLYTASRPLIVRNLLAWIRDAENSGARQAEALEWAKEQLGFAGATPNFADVLNSSGGREKRAFPLLAVTRRSTSMPVPESDFALEVTHTLRLDMWVVDADPNTLTEKMEVYSLAVSSMVWACPPSVLMAGVQTEGHPTVNVTEMNGDETRGAGAPFIQLPYIVATVNFLEVRPNG